MSSEKQGLSNFGKGSYHSPTKIQKAGKDYYNRWKAVETRIEEYFAKLTFWLIFTTNEFVSHKTKRLICIGKISCKESPSP